MSLFWNNFAVLVCCCILQVYGAHDCDRACTKNEQPRECRFVFTLQPVITRSEQRCWTCLNATSSCEEQQCGHVRSFLSINRQLPGPPIKVCQNDLVFVELQNRLPAGWEAALHWHGITQKGSAHMDGVPMLTQCPVPPGANFLYSFVAREPGTHLYYAHSGIIFAIEMSILRGCHTVLQQADGIYGALIVREPVATTAKEQELVIAPWSNTMLSSAYGALHGDLRAKSVPTAILINGKSKNFQVKLGERSFLRLINAAALDCPIKISITNHVFKIIAIGGSNILPLFTKTLNIFPGERYTVEVIEQSSRDLQEASTLRLEGLHACQSTAPHEATLEYDTKKTSRPAELFNFTELVTSDCSEATSKGSTALCSLQLLTRQDEINLAPLNEPSVSFVLPFGQASVGPVSENDLEFRFVLHDTAYYPTFLDSSETKDLRVPHVNQVTFRLPASPPLVHPEDAVTIARSECESLPGEVTAARRPTEFCKPPPYYCECTHVIKLALNATAEIVLVHQAEAADSTAQTLHLHGLRFAVTRWRGQDEAEWHEVSRPVLRDTVTVPKAGAVTLRLLADNPGFWLLESRSGHVGSAGVGAAVVVQVGQKGELPSVPENFPRCSGLRPDDVIF